MLRSDAIEVENKLAFAMLEEVSKNPYLKRMLQDISQLLITNVFVPLRLNLQSANSYNELPLEYKELVSNLAAEHSAENRQYGALMSRVASSANIIDSIEHILQMLDELERYIQSLNELQTADEMAIALKILVELGYSYYETKSLHHAQFKAINDLVSTTAEELDIRIFRTELNEPAKLALTFGIGSSATDLGLQSDGVGRSAGKAAFAVVSMKKRLAVLCEAYDKAPTDRLRAKMKFYNIPLEKDKREALEDYAKRYETCFEKMVKDTSLPLIASVSRATTRVLVSLQDLHAFTRADGSYDLEKAQMLANCIMAFIVHAGHHSIVEVAEVHNRLLDYMALEQFKRQGPTATMIEINMPYYRIGNYHSFFSRDYADKVMDAGHAVVPTIQLR